MLLTTVKGDNLLHLKKEKKTPTASLLLNDKWPCFLSQHFWVSTNFDKIYIKKKIWVCVFNLDANICAVFIFYFWSKKNPNAFTFIFYTTCPVFPPHLIGHSCWNNRARSGLFCFYCKVSKQASPCQMMCMHTHWKTMPLVCRKVFAGTAAGTPDLWGKV